MCVERRKLLWARIYYVIRVTKKICFHINIEYYGVERNVKHVMWCSSHNNHFSIYCGTIHKLRSQCALGFWPSIRTILYGNNSESGQFLTPPLDIRTSCMVPEKWQTLLLFRPSLCLSLRHQTFFLVELKFNFQFAVLEEKNWFYIFVFLSVFIYSQNVDSVFLWFIHCC